MVIFAAETGNARAVRGFVEPSQGVAAARNRAIRESQGRWIAFHDDDQIADPRWLVELLNLANEKRCPVVGGDVRLILPEKNTRQLSGVCRRLLGEMVGMTEVCQFGRKLVPGTNNMMIERTLFDKVGTFDETMLAGGEDAELYRRIRSTGCECWYTPRAVVHHIIPEHRLETNTCAGRQCDTASMLPSENYTIGADGHCRGWQPLVWVRQWSAICRNTWPRGWSAIERQRSAVDAYCGDPRHTCAALPAICFLAGSVSRHLSRR
jgi:cellulose synthase/poly-beta-1,6-N-acetylglucosamine synthase-like glycosyltransferase